MKKIKVGIDIRDLHIAKTGARTYLEELIKALEAHPNKTFKYILIDTKSNVYVGTNKFFKVIEHIKFFFWKQIVLPIKAKVKGCEILICTDYFVPYFSLGIKTIPVFHDAFFYEYPTQYNKYWLFLFKHLAVKAAKKSVSVVTPTNYSKIQIAKHSTIPKDKIEVIYEAAKSLSLTTDKSIKNLQNSLQVKNYLLHVGTMEKRKNIPSLLKVFNELKPEFPFLKLVLIGQFSPKSDMNDQKEIMRTIENLNLKKEVIFPGYISDDDLAVFYKDALAYVFPTVNEGFGIPILESFSKKLPVLASNNTCLPEIGGDAVLYFDPYDLEDMKQKLRNVITDEELRQNMILKGSSRLKSFSWDHTANAFVGIFTRIVKI